jgi:diaminopimelate epimerase
MHGLGNDFVIFDFRAKDYQLTNEQITNIGKRHTGVGFDQLIILKSSADADCEMVIYNHDGSRAEACGNATRCVAMLLGQKELSIKVNEKILSAKYISDEEIRVNMGKPDFEWDKIPLAHEADPMDLWLSGVKGQAVSMGNPHLVIFVNDSDKYNVKDLGPKFENDEMFPNRINVNFAQVIDENNIKLRIWERGTGETVACGSGACATYAVANRFNKVNGKTKIHLKGGVLEIEATQDGSIIMTGPACKVFEGEIKL